MSKEYAIIERVRFKRMGTRSMKPVIVTIVGTQRDVCGEETRIELITVGHYKQKQDVQYITYKDSEVSGLEGTATMLKVYSDHVVLVRLGSIQQKQEFYVGKKMLSEYATPYGSMEIGVLTQSMNIALAAAAGTLTIRYELEVNGQWQSTNTLLISLQEEEQGEYKRVTPNSN